MAQVLVGWVGWGGVGHCCTGGQVASSAATTATAATTTTTTTTPSHHCCHCHRHRHPSPPLLPPLPTAAATATPSHRCCCRRRRPQDLKNLVDFCGTRPQVQEKVKELLNMKVRGSCCTYARGVTLFQPLSTAWQVGQQKPFQVAPGGRTPYQQGR